jgi:hypothetical protein
VKLLGWAEAELRGDPADRPDAIIVGSEKAADRLEAAADGVFLAARLSVELAASRERERGASDLGSVLEPGDWDAVCSVKLDDMFQETVDRVLGRLIETSDSIGFGESGRTGMRRILKRMLGVLVVTLEPLSMGLVAPLASARPQEVGGAFADQVLNALSLLFSHVAGSDRVEPIHKSVVDYLRDATRSKAQAVDEEEAACAMAMACARVLEMQLAEPSGDGNVAAEPALRHALQYGHVYLSVALERAARRLGDAKRGGAAKAADEVNSDGGGEWATLCKEAEANVGLEVTVADAARVWSELSVEERRSERQVRWRLH